jgi:hypothetical protein
MATSLLLCNKEAQLLLFCLKYSIIDRCDAYVII